MTVARLCACGSPLLEDPDLCCPACGARATTWLVCMDGEVVAAATADEVHLHPDFANALGFGAPGGVGILSVLAPGPRGQASAPVYGPESSK